MRHSDTTDCENCSLSKKQAISKLRLSTVSEHPNYNLRWSPCQSYKHHGNSDSIVHISLLSFASLHRREHFCVWQLLASCCWCVPGLLLAWQAVVVRSRWGLCVCRSGRSLGRIDLACRGRPPITERYGRDVGLSPLEREGERARAGERVRRQASVSLYVRSRRSEPSERTR